MDQRAEQLQKEFAVQESQRVPTEIGGIPPVVAATTKQEAQPEALQATAEQTEEIMIPKHRFDDINRKYQELRDLPKAEPAPTLDIENLIEKKLAPMRIKLEVDEVQRKYQDFPDLAAGALERIKIKPSLTLEEAVQLEKFSKLESKAKEEGKNEALQTIEKKASLHTEFSGRKTVAKPVEELIHDKSVPLSELAKMLPHD